MTTNRRIGIAGVAAIIVGLLLAVLLPFPSAHAGTSDCHAGPYQDAQLHVCRYSERGEAHLRLGVLATEPVTVTLAAYALDGWPDTWPQHLLEADSKTLQPGGDATLHVSASACGQLDLVRAASVPAVLRHTTFGSTLIPPSGTRSTSACQTSSSPTPTPTSSTPSPSSSSEPSTTPSETPTTGSSEPAGPTPTASESPVDSASPTPSGPSEPSVIPVPPTTSPLPGLATTGSSDTSPAPSTAVATSSTPSAALSTPRASQPPVSSGSPAPSGPSAATPTASSAPSASSTPRSRHSRVVAAVPSGTSATASPTSSSSLQAASAPGELAHTGSTGVPLLAGSGASLLALGALLQTAARRRRTA